MKEILLVRHAEAYANLRNFTAFGNLDSPLTETGQAQTAQLRETFQTEFDIDPESYVGAVATSEFTRAQQTAELTGFKNIDTLALINESDVDREIVQGKHVVRRHQAERWVPNETVVRVKNLFDRIQTGELEYDIYFTHGMFIAGCLLECDARGIQVGRAFHEERGYVPDRASVTRIAMPVIRQFASV